MDDKHIILEILQEREDITTKKITLLLLTLLLLNACTQKPESVTLTVNQKSITDTSLTLLLENNLKEEIMYGKFYEIKIKDSGTWKKLDAIDDIFFTHLGHLVSPNKNKPLNSIGMTSMLI